LIGGAYHFLRSGPSARDQVSHFLDVIGDPTGLLVQLDWEISEGDLAPPSVARAWVNEWNRRTNGHPALIYLPHWVWADHLGSPSGLSDMGPLWASHYITTPGPLAPLALRVPGQWWNGYDGWARPKILQFTDVGQVAGVSSVDFNAFDGTLLELQALTGLEPTTREDDVLGGELSKDTVVPVYDFGDGRVQHVALTGAFIGDGKKATVRFVQHSWVAEGWGAEEVYAVTDGGFVNVKLKDETDIVTLQRVDAEGGIVSWVLAYDTK
jgi:hypothetical protein